jgi:hypothetical protein
VVRHRQSRIKNYIAESRLFTIRSIVAGVIAGVVESPKIAIAVLVENGGFGGATAAPIAQKVLDAYLLGPDATVEDAKKIPRKAAL